MAEEITENELWKEAQKASKVALVMGLDGMGKSIWVWAIIAVTIAVIAYFIVPQPPPKITLIAASKGMICAVMEDRLFFTDKTKKSYTSQTLESTWHQMAMNTHRVAFLNRVTGSFYSISYGDKNILKFNDNLKDAVLCGLGEKGHYFVTKDFIHLPSNKKIKTPKIIKPLALIENNGVWLVDYDRIFKLEESDFKELRLDGRPIRSVSITDKIKVVHDGSELDEFDLEGKYLTRIQLQSWTGTYSQTIGSLFVLDGDDIVVAEGSKILIGKGTEEQPPIVIDLLESK